MTILKFKTVSGIKWSTISQVGRQGTQLLTTVILARLLTPSDFGLVGMAMVIVGFIGIFKDLGTSAAIIQRKELSESLLTSIFWINVGFGILAMIILYFFAPVGAMLYHEPRVTVVLQVLSTSFFISSLGILHQALLERSVSFESLAKLELISVFVGAIVGIGLALNNRGVWSLVFQTLTTVSIATVLLWQSSSWRPQWLFHWNEVKAVRRFSLNLTGYNIFNYFARNVDYLLIGRYLGAQDLGYYTLAYRILLFPLQNISAVIGRVTYPVFSTIQDDNKRFASAYLKVVEGIALIAFPLMMGVLALAKPFILTFFGEKWQQVIPLVMILAPIGLIQSVGATVGPIYQVKGRTDWMLHWGFGAGTFTILSIIIGLYWGIVGVAAAYAIASLILLYPNFAIPFRLINLKFVQMLKVLRRSLLNSSLMFITVILVRAVLPPWFSDFAVLGVSVAVGTVTYAVTSWLTNRSQLQELWEIAELEMPISVKHDGE
jgi:lipopolysaccharide exporter